MSSARLCSILPRRLGSHHLTRNKSIVPSSFKSHHIFSTLPYPSQPSKLTVSTRFNNYSTNANTKNTAKPKMTPLPGGCYCGSIRYVINLEDPETQARTSICHCGNCKRFTGGEHGITTKIPKSALEVTKGKNHIKVHEADNGSGVLLHREFCGTCGGPLLEYGANAGDKIYVFYGTMEDHARGQVEPKGEFFCKLRDPWMPEIEGLFQKQEIKE
ncbi:Mss4-like protein [Hypoxylon sp. FL0890]|nr:Mss4-like protein [Hypoxylon sp. FL0890]